MKYITFYDLIAKCAKAGKTQTDCINNVDKMLKVYNADQRTHPDGMPINNVSDAVRCIKNYYD